MRHWSFYYGAQAKQFRSLVISPGVFYYELLFVGQVELIILFTDCSVHICPQFCWKDFSGFWEILARRLDVKSVDSWFGISMWFNVFKYLKATANRMSQKLGAFICSNYQTCTLSSVIFYTGTVIIYFVLWSKLYWYLFKKKTLLYFSCSMFQLSCKFFIYEWLVLEKLNHT